jgi:tRNA threonylcarbamoyladenosine biosynthesis protein TsaB
MLEGVNALLEENAKLLLIDTCGETAGAALSAGDQVLIAEDLARGSASAEIISAVRRLLRDAGWQLQDLHAVGVVTGPGSFTGIRAGLAAAKGLCEATGLPLAAVSRLEVLADAASLQDGFAALDAGRGEVYVREHPTKREWLSSTDDLAAASRGRSVVVAEPRLAERLTGCAPVLHPLHAADALRTVLRRLKDGGSDVAITDANYVREERDIYPKPAEGAKPPRVQLP